LDVEIESAVSKDFEAIVALERQCFTSEAFSRQQLLYLLRDYSSTSLVARGADGGVVGFVIVQLDKDRDKSEKGEGVVFGHIVTLNVAVNFRRRGVARKLLFKCEEVLKLCGVFECRLEVRQANYVALALYRQMGYVEMGILRWYYGKEHGLYFKKKFS